MLLVVGAAQHRFALHPALTTRLCITCGAGYTIKRLWSFRSHDGRYMHSGVNCVHESSGLLTVGTGNGAIHVCRQFTGKRESPTILELKGGAKAGAVVALAGQAGEAIAAAFADGTISVYFE